MPSPRAGTVTQEIGKTVKEYKAGRSSSATMPRASCTRWSARSSFDAKQLTENIQAFIDHVNGMKPSGVKGHYVKTIFLSGTMSPGCIRVAA